VIRAIAAHAAARAALYLLLMACRLAQGHRLLTAAATRLLARSVNLSSRPPR
jgi:hypothetical protein